MLDPNEFACKLLYAASFFLLTIANNGRKIIVTNNYGF